MSTPEPSSPPGRARFARIAVASALSLAVGAIWVVGGQARPPTVTPEVHGGGIPAASATMATAMATPEVVAVHGGIPAAPTTTATPDVVAVWARIDEGWIFVYDDGRVLSHPDEGPILERRLSPHGLDLVRRGTLPAQELQLYLSMTVPAEAWSEPIPKAFRPDRYAVCKLDADGPPDAGGVLGDVGAIWRRLPPQVQARFREGRILSFSVDPVGQDSPYVGQDGHHLERGPGVACFVLSPGQARAVWAQTRETGISREDPPRGLRMGDTTIAEPIGVAGSDFRFLAVPLLPHGGGIFWGGRPVHG